MNYFSTNVRLLDNKTLTLITRLNFNRMKKHLLLFILFLSINSFCADLPKKILGQYQVKIEAFDFQDNGRTVKAGAYLLSITLKEEFLYYTCGKLTFVGTYSDISEDSDNVVLKANIANDYSVSFDLDISVNKKNLAMNIAGLKGVEVAQLARKEIVIKPSTRLGRL